MKNFNNKNMKCWFFHLFRSYTMKKKICCSSTWVFPKIVNGIFLLTNINELLHQMETVAIIQYLFGMKKPILLWQNEKWWSVGGFWCGTSCNDNTKIHSGILRHGIFVHACNMVHIRCGYRFSLDTISTVYSHSFFFIFCIPLYFSHVFNAITIRCFFLSYKKKMAKKKLLHSLDLKL